MNRDAYDDDGPIAPEGNDYLAAAVDVGVPIAAIWLAIWWFNLPSVDDVVKSEESFRSFWATSWPLLIAVGLALGTGAAAAAGIRRGLLPDKLVWLRWIPVGAVVIAGGLLGYLAPASLTVAGNLREYVDLQVSRTQDVDKKLREKATKAAEALAEQKADTAKKAVEEADGRLNRQKEEAKKVSRSFATCSRLLSRVTRLPKPNSIRR